MAQTFLVLFAFFALFGAAEPAEETRPAGYLDYEIAMIRSHRVLLSAGAVGYREASLERGRIFEGFLEKHPNSPVSPEAKLRLAEIYRDVESAEVDMLRKEFLECELRAESKQKIQLCEILFDLQTKNFSWRDGNYFAYAMRILWELVEKHGHKTRYFPGYDIEEERGGVALYYIAEDTRDKAKRDKIYRRILKEYKIRSELKEKLESLLRSY